jgi:hypothetical protein
MQIAQKGTLQARQSDNAGLEHSINASQDGAGSLGNAAVMPESLGKNLAVLKHRNPSLSLRNNNAAVRLNV